MMTLWKDWMQNGKLFEIKIALKSRKPSPIGLIEMQSKRNQFKSMLLTLIGKSWKTQPSIFCEYLFSFWKISGHKLVRLLENSSIFWWVFQKSICVTPRNSSKIIFRPNSLFWMSFREIGPKHAPKLYNWRLDEFSRNQSGSCPGNLPIGVNFSHGRLDD